MRSPIKYFGGKGGFGNDIYAMFPDKSRYESYIEPFGGGASMLFIKEPFGCEIYNDLEENVYSLFKVLKDKKLFKEFKALCDMDCYSRRLRADYIEDLKTGDLDIVTRAYKYFYVNRSSRNGIGGFSVTANYIRRNMSKSVSDFLSCIDRLPDIHDRLSRVIIESQDGMALMKKFDRKKTFIYADPPYHHDTRTGTRYKVDMDDDMQVKFIDTVLAIKNAMVLISGYDCDEYKRLGKNGWQQIDMTISTTGGDHKPKEKIESLWFNYDLKEIESPQEHLTTLFTSL